MTELDIRGFVRRVMEILDDDFCIQDADEIAIKFGLLEEHDATEQDCATEWGRDVNLEVGDTLTRRSAALKAYLKP